MLKIPVVFFIKLKAKYVAEIKNRKKKSELP